MKYHVVTDALTETVEADNYHIEPDGSLILTVVTTTVAAFARGAWRYFTIDKQPTA